MSFSRLYPSANIICTLKVSLSFLCFMVDLFELLPGLEVVPETESTSAVASYCCGRCPLLLL